jgi:ketosteroid isomerase-like protein
MPYTGASLCVLEPENRGQWRYSFTLPLLFTNPNQIIMKIKTQLTPLFVMVAMYFVSCTQPAETPKSVDLEKLKVEIQAMEDGYAAAEKAKDADGVVAYYSDDAVNYGRNTEPRSGKAAIKERIAETLAKDTTGNSNVYKVVDLFADGNMLVEIGSWSEVNPAGVEVEKGYYMSYFEKRDGKYVCVRDMNVTTKPEKEGA